MLDFLNHHLSNLIAFFNSVFFLSEINERDDILAPITGINDATEVFHVRPRNQN